MAEGIRYYDTGKRKTAIARVWLMPGNGKITVNRRPLEVYFPLETHTTLIQEPFRITQTLGQYDVLITVRGGGVSSGVSHSTWDIKEPAPYRCGSTANAETGGFFDTRFACHGTQEIRAKESAQTFPILQTLETSIHRGSWVYSGGLWSRKHT